MHQSETTALRMRLDPLQATWHLPNDDFAKTLLNPALAVAESVDCMSGYFNVAVLREIAPGLAGYLIASEEPFRLLISPQLSGADLAALEAGMDPTALVKELVGKAFESEEALQSALVLHTKECLAYLMHHRRLQMRVVLMKEGLFHPKKWYMRSGDDLAILSGSANATQAGFTRNVEHLTLHRNWKNNQDFDICQKDSFFFDEYWNGRAENAITVTLERAIQRELLERYVPQQAPSTSAYEIALMADIGVAVTEPALRDVAGFRIPLGLTWETGAYSHQGFAVKAWEAAGRKGILEMATGAGKTLTSLIGAARTFQEQGPIFVIVAAPTKILVRQWESDLQWFGLDPYLALDSTSDQHLRNLDRRLYGLSGGGNEADSAIVTHNMLKNPKFAKLLSRYADRVMVIADEVHNLGLDSFIDVAPDVKYRLGLSATPIRQYDDAGTRRLFEYFGSVVFQFSLDQAIGVCLVPYDYHVHEVALTQEEIEEYEAKTLQLGKAIARQGGSIEGLTGLMKQRRRVIEAAANKLTELETLLKGVPKSEVGFALIYCTAADPKQLIAVNDILIRLGIRFHQVTDEESGNKAVMKEIIANFRSGSIQILTAKKVLDEGFNVPEIRTAYLLASSTVEREWTQRRGRVLRMSIGKAQAVIHDFVALPPEGSVSDEDATKMVRGELARLDEFRRLAKNGASADGPGDDIVEIKRRYVFWNDALGTSRS